MSKADEKFITMCRDIIDNGFSTEGEKVRPKWEDGTYAYTLKRFGVVNRYDLSEEFPAITLRKTYVKSAIDELLWIWQKKSNNVNDLNSHIWDAWADENGSIGKAYGYQLGVKHQYKEGMMDQVDRVIFDLKNNPYSRRIMTNIYVHQDLSEMNLYPCAYSVTFNVTGDKLNAILNQRSQDVLAANNWNVVQYAVLVHMLAQVTGFKPGELVHVISDAHIYDRHIPIVKELIERPVYPAPKFTMNPDIKDFYEFTVDDFTIEDYVTGGQGINVWKERYGQLLQMAELSFPGLSLYMGGEIFYRTDTVSELISHKIPTMVGGRYVLLEFDVSISYGKITQAIMEVIQNEYIPIIAHVERYECLLGYVDRICELKELGAYIQVNVSGVMGEHGKPEKKFIKKLLKREMINFVATDAHRDDKRAPYIKDCCRYIEKKYGYDYAKRIFSDNPACIISNRFIEE